MDRVALSKREGSWGRRGEEKLNRKKKGEQPRNSSSQKNKYRKKWETKKSARENFPYKQWGKKNPKKKMGPTFRPAKTR